MTKELEPCPFCGSNASIRTDILMFSGIVKAIVECDGCDVYIVSHGKTKDEAIQKASELWNTRYKRTCHPVEKFNSISPWPVMVCSECGRPLHYDNIDVSRDDEDYEYAPFCVCGAEVVDD